MTNSNTTINAATEPPRLPSPAPSEDSFNPSAFTPEHLAAIQVRSRSYGSISASLPTAPAFRSSPWEQPHSRPTSTQPGSMRGTSNISPQMQPLQPPRGQHQIPRPLSATSRIPPFTPPALPRNGLPQGPPSSSTAELLSRLDREESILRSELTGVDSARLDLLRQAVTRDDWFYQMLNQLFCLHSVDSKLLPKSIRNLQVSSFDFLARILCPNSGVDARLLKFLSEFPEPIMDIYSDQHGSRERFEVRAQAVKIFLVHLPLQWDNLVNMCKYMKGPPLVQDLSERLLLPSVVMQTTCFRMIARVIWGNDGPLAVLEDLHELDQMLFHHGYLRDSNQKKQAYDMWRRTYNTWQAQAAAQQARGTTLEFTLPQDILDFFGKPPPQAPAVQAQQVRNPQLLRPMRPQQLPHSQFVSVLNGQPHPAHQQPPQPVQHQNPLQQRHRPLLQTGIQSHAHQASSPTTSHSPFPSTQQMVQQPGLRTGPAQSTRRAVFPLSTDVPRPQPTEPDSNRSALHQAVLRSPTLGPTDAIPNVPILYRYVAGYALPPTQVRNELPSQSVHFNISPECFNQIPETKAIHIGQRHVRLLTEGALTYRLRCAAMPSDGFTCEGIWITADHYWPEDLAFNLNGVQLDTRRKLHHGRYLPIDLTALIQEGENTLTVFVNIRDTKLHSASKYAIAIEAVRVTSYSTIKASLSYVPANESLEAIKKSISNDDSSSSNDDDWELFVESSNMTIKLVDPFTGSQLVNIPVRGRDCLHKDVFDLETYLSICKREQPGWPTVVDCWRCPLCRGDVRPQTLVVDEFLVHVLNEFKTAGYTANDVRAIIVEADGRWRAKPEAATGVRSSSLDREMDGQAASTPAHSLPPLDEIIILD